MNGGKRTRQRTTSKNDEELDENSCPNLMKKRKVDEECAKSNDPPKNLPPIVEEVSEGSKDLISSDSEDEEVTVTEAGVDAMHGDDSDGDAEHTPADKYETSPAVGVPRAKGRGSPPWNMVTPEHQTANFRLGKRTRIIPKEINQFGRLSDEMVLQIFSWLHKPTLCKAAGVCRRWRQIAYDDSLWSRLDLSSRAVNPRNLEHVVKRGVSILRLANAQICDTVIKTPSSYLPPGFISKLNYLDLSMAQISKKGLFELLNTCRHMRKLSLEMLEVDQKVCEAVGLNPNLECLNLSSVQGLHSNGLEAILACCSKLLCLNLGWTNMDSETLETLCTTLPTCMARLNIAGCRKNLSNDNVKKLVSRCSKLEELDLSDCTHITGTAVEHIVKGLSSLEHLSLSRCYSITESDLLGLAQSHSLAYADVFGVLHENNLASLRKTLEGIFINKFQFSSIARPTVGVRRTSIWGLRVRD